ncbi:aldo-keto reductase family 1 member A1-like [Schistocerca americana]|uniref:aldo-keto reductase family 1 member A1-like n=1 Tax=Schistocerca americana TaxID=7009 RepID=UPI001F4F761C|nr:aldo-keto reductase family 1 member A1-like [Schistocerca americana]XP_047114035.1 aldo-keto reductase family 1 member A1-like [Schistocerca piceifrons]
MKTIKLNNGSEMPIVGLGTWQATDEEVETAINTALEAGYRHIDTAYVYMNEAPIGRALKKWLDSGKVKREELFIVTKLPNFGNHPDRVEKYIKRSLAALQLDYLDLYLVHHPCGLVEREGDMLPRDESGALLVDKETDIISVWKAMEKLVDAGLTRAIGLSNFNSNQIKRITDSARIVPANLQVELHVYFQQRELVAFCHALDISVCAYAPIGSPGLQSFVKMIGDDPEMIPKLSPLTEPVVCKLAEKYNKTPAQVLLRHIIQRDIAVIPKSANPQRIKQNIDIFDFELSNEEMEELNALDKGHKGRLFGEHMLKGINEHPEYPYRAPY